MDGRKLKDHVIQVYQAIRQVLSHEEKQFLYRSLQDYKQNHDAEQLALELCKICTCLDKAEIVRNVWTQIIHGPYSEFDRIMKEHPLQRSNHQILLKVDQFSKESEIISHKGELFDEDILQGNRHVIKIHKSGEESAGFCIRGGLEHGLGIYVSGVEAGSVAEESGLKFGDKIMEVNNISFGRLPSSTAIKVMTGSNQLKLVVERTGIIPEWRLSRERTVWYDCQTEKLSHGMFEDTGSTQFIRGLGVDIPERRVTLSDVPDQEDLGFNIRGGNEYRLGIYVSKVDRNSLAEKHGLQVGDQITDVNGIPFDNISHAHAVETLKNNSHLIVTLRDVWRYPAYKEIYAEYTWTGTSIPHGENRCYDGERLIERKLPDTWIQSNVHRKRKNLHTKVPVQVISYHHNDSDILHPEIYLPENNELSQDFFYGSSNSESSFVRSKNSSFKPVDTWIGHSNPAFEPDDMGAYSDGRSSGDNSSYNESSLQGEYNITMEDIINKKEKHQKQSPLNIYSYMINNSQDNLDEGSVNEDGKKSVERYIFNDDEASLAENSVLGDSGLDIKDDDLRSETLSRESLIGEDDTQSYHSGPTFTSFNQNSHQSVAITTLDGWKKSVESLTDDNSTQYLNKSVNYRESTTDEVDIGKDEHDSIDDTDTNFTISVVSGSVYEKDNRCRESRFKKKDDNRNKTSRFKSNIIAKDSKSSIANIDSEDNSHGNLYEIVNESTDDPDSYSNGLRSSNGALVIDNDITLLSSDDMETGINKLYISDLESDRQIGNRVRIDSQSSTDDIYNQTELIMQDFDRQIKSLESRKSEIGMYEMSNLTSQQDSLSDSSTKREKRGSLFKLSRRKSSDMSSKRSSWKLLKKKIRSGLFRKSEKTETLADFVWSKYNPNTYDDEGMVVLEKSANELFADEEVASIIKHIRNYHGDHNINRLVEYLLMVIDVPEKILILKDVRQVIYKFDMYQFDELVKQFEIDAYEKLSTNVHRQLNHEKRGKPKRNILQPETDDFGHFFIKPTGKQKDREQEIERQVIMNDHQPQVTLTFNSDQLPSARYEDDQVYRDKYGQDVVVVHVSKQKESLGLCISGGVECKQQPQVKVDEVMEGGAAADEPRLQPGMIILAIDDTDLRETTHTDAILTLKKSFSNKKNPDMVVVLTNSVVC